MVYQEGVGRLSYLSRPQSTAMADTEKTLVMLILTVFCLALFAAAFEIMLSIVTCVWRSYVDCFGDPGPYELPVYFRPPIDSGDYVEMGPIHPCNHAEVPVSVEVVDETVSSPAQGGEETGSVVGEEKDADDCVSDVPHMTIDQGTLHGEVEDKHDD